MANKAISELPQAQNVNNQDLFVLEQSGIAKKLTAETFITEQGIIDALAEALDGHGGISSVTLSSVSGRIRTYLITFTDGSATTFQVYDGTTIERIAKTSTAGLVDTYTIFMSDGTTSFFQVTNGGYGLDRTLTMSNAAAPADLVGDLKSAFNIFSSTVDDALNVVSAAVSANGYLLYTNGNISSSTDYQVTDFVQVNAGDIIHYKGVISGSGSNLGVALYTKPTGSADFAVALVVLSGGSGRVYTEQKVIVPDTYGNVLFVRAASAYNNTSDPSYPKAPVFLTVTKPTYRPTETATVYQGEYEQGGYSATEPTVSTQRIHMKDCVALPYGDKTVLTITCNPKYLFAVRAGRIPQDLSSNLYWYVSGQQVRFSSHEQYYRIIWAKGVINTGNYENLSPSDITDINPVITYSFDGADNAEDIECLNADSLERLVNAQNVLSGSSHGGIGSMPLVFHASDFHGDIQRVKNAMLLSEHYNADALVLSGDIVANKPSDGADWLHELFAGYSGKPIICTGNHEVNESGITDAQVYSYYMQPSAAKIGNSNWKTYYYTDIASKSLRIIVTDIYQYGATTRSNAHMSSEQLAYICSALKSTPNGYGVLIVSHAPCVDVGSLANQQYPTFFQPLRKYGFAHYDISGAPIYDIIDAFIGRTTISKTYTQTGSPSSISVSDDFSGVSSTVEFIAHLTGHIHEDSVCYLPTTHKQLMLNICCGNAMNGGSAYPYLADDCDITRVPFGKTQDAINAYVIDRTNKIVKIVRLGGTLTYDMNDRDYMAIPYAD